jgi:hypothetical protein
MSNRDYYGDNVPAGLTQNTSTDPAMNYTTQFTSEQQVQHNQQPQGQWPDQYRAGDYDPNLNPNTLPEGEGERGLGSTVVGGAGVCDPGPLAFHLVPFTFVPFLRRASRQ